MTINGIHVIHAREYVTDWQERPAFTQWMAQVDACVSRITDGMSFLDLPDVDFAVMFDEGYDPEDAARECTDYAGFE